MKLPLAKALLFDLNGTMIDDMSFHILVWQKIVNDLGANLSVEEVKKQCYGKNGDLLERVFPGRFTDAEKDAIGIKKETTYQEIYKPHLKLIPGLDAFLQKANANNIPIGIGSAAIMFNINFVLDNLHIGHYFKAIVSADDVAESKPHPETFTKCADELGVAYQDCIVFEDAPKGVECAANAGMQCIVLTTMHPKEDFAAYNNIIGFVEDYSGLEVG
jgi:beta-phosphoglucomutase